MRPGRAVARSLALAAALIVAALLAVPTAQAQPAAAAPATGFDHLLHRTRVEVSGADNPACESCHPLTPAGALRGRPGHAACFPCHGPAPRRGARVPSPPPAVCVACHPPAGLRGPRPSLASPAYGPAHEHGLALDHARHTATACERCHPAVRTGAPAPHARCASCHLRQPPLMSACLACHPPEVGPDTRPHLVEPTLAVGRAFSHERHAARAAGAPAAACATCHRAITTATGRELPTPTAASCSPAGCHDGAAAFGLTVACTRCHPAPAVPPPPATAPPRRFVHDQHARLLPVAACDRCHRLDRRGEPTVPEHAACADAGCHATDFGSPTPITCGACHLSSEPWRPLLPDQHPPAESELPVALSHRRHPGTCTDCHQRSTAGRPPRPPRGHAACATAGCHASESGPAPRLDACAGCHRPGLVAERRRRDSLALWSVAARFQHERHRVDPRGGGALACTACHAPPVLDAAGDLPLPPPPKARCAPCHDGATAFKMTGHGCARCHGRAEPTP